MSGGGSGRQDWPGGSGGAAPRTRRSDGFCRLLSPAQVLPQPQVDAHRAAPPIGCQSPRGGAAAPPLVGRARGRGRRCEGSVGRGGGGAEPRASEGRPGPPLCEEHVGILFALEKGFSSPSLPHHVTLFLFHVLHPLLGKSKLATIV